MMWTDDLKTEYETGRKRLQTYAGTLDTTDIHQKQEKSYVNGAIKNSREVEEWLETGRDPKAWKGIDKNAIYHRNSFDHLEGMDLIPDIKEELEAEPPPLHMTHEMKQQMANILITLSARERQCYIRHKAQGMSMAEIAQELEVSKASVQIYINRAKKKISEIL